MKLSIFTGKKNLNKSKNKTLQSLGKQDSEETYILCQTSERDRSSSPVLKKSDTDKSLLSEENDGYERYQSDEV